MDTDGRATAPTASPKVSRTRPTPGGVGQRGWSLTDRTPVLSSETTGRNGWGSTPTGTVWRQVEQLTEIFGGRVRTQDPESGYINHSFVFFVCFWTGSLQGTDDSPAPCLLRDLSGSSPPTLPRPSPDSLRSLPLSEKGPLTPSEGPPLYSDPDFLVRVSTKRSCLQSPCPTPTLGRGAPKLPDPSNPFGLVCPTSLDTTPRSRGPDHQHTRTDVLLHCEPPSS